MLLSEGCEVEKTGHDGKRYLGIRWKGSKGFDDHVKLILPVMADVAREAIARVRRVTAPAREMARWYEDNPSVIFLPTELEHLRTREFLEYEEIAEIIGINGRGKCRGNVGRWAKTSGLPIVKRSRSPNGPSTQVVLFADFEQFVLRQLPIGFPIYDSKSGMKYSEALFVFPEGMFQKHAASRCMSEPLRYHHVACSFGQNSRAQSVSVFRRVGLDPENRLSIKSHQFRHWLNTLAQGANLSQVDIAKWSGRTSIYQNAAYDHVSSEDIVRKLREAVGDNKKAIGPLADIPKNLPVTRSQFAEMTVPTAHVTLYGFCIHDFTTTPCEKFRQCLDCREHVCVKGMPDKATRVQHALDAALNNLSKARTAVADEVFGAEDWIATHAATVERLEHLVSILNDPSVADGAVIQLSSTNTHSLLEGALIDRANADHTAAIGFSQAKAPRVHT